MNTGPWLTAYSAPALAERIARERVVLPVCSLGTPADDLENLGPLLLPPFYHEALAGDLKAAMIARVRQCFPYDAGSNRRAACPGTIDVVELPRRPPPSRSPTAVVAFSADTAVEEQGPHLPLATDRIQSYAILREAARQIPELGLIARAVATAVADVRALLQPWPRLRGFASHEPDRYARPQRRQRPAGIGVLAAANGLVFVARPVHVSPHWTPRVGIRRSRV